MKITKIWLVSPYGHDHIDMLPIACATEALANLEAAKMVNVMIGDVGVCATSKNWAKLLKRHLDPYDDADVYIQQIELKEAS